MHIFHIIYLLLISLSTASSSLSSSSSSSLSSSLSSSSSSSYSSHPHYLPKANFNPFDSPDYCSQIITSTCNTTFSYIDDLNKNIRQYIKDLVKTSYFRYFKVNLDKQCKFWSAQHFCATENCAVEILEDFNWNNITNVNLKPSKLGKINTPNTTGLDVNSLETATEIQNCHEEFDYSYIDEEDHECVYVNLLNNPERFTGYGGNQSFDVWKAIYSENCFPNTNPMSMLPNQPKEQCVEKNLFYRLVSGMHASIAVHLSNEYLNPITGEFYPNLNAFMQRVGNFNDRLSNIYFNFALVSQSLVKLNDILPLREFIASGYDDITPKQNEHILLENEKYENREIYNELLLDDIIPALSSNTLFNTSSLFDPELVDANLKNEFRARFKNISSIMDCVGCDRCRMWGKIQTIGYGTALKILFEDDLNYSNLKFRRIEIVALINTLDRLSKSIEAINNFKQMYLKHVKDVNEGLAQPGDYDDDDRQKNNAGFQFPFVSFEKPTIKPTETQAPKPSSSRKSIKQILETKSHDRTFIEDLRLSFDEVWQATKFVLTSYQQFPILLGKLGLFQLNHWWNQLIGKPITYEYQSAIDYEAKEYSRLIN
ncbi:unnamed protein product [Candida verbasci]|uniref:Endoplasmic oxidoreductin-1 n=1 Tax=Candida verbasci TaxID=1227364 RepID=A0A9W4TT74_9ASCO|nr:unnamed protein product [Candida verbasci]